MPEQYGLDTTEGKYRTAHIDILMKEAKCLRSTVFDLEVRSDYKRAELFKGASQHRICNYSPNQQTDLFTIVGGTERSSELMDIRGA